MKRSLLELRRVWCGLLGLLCCAGSIWPLRATEDLDLLREAIDQWSAERDAWAFTQTVREFDEAGRSRTRIERYDPTRGDVERWNLVSIDGRPPTDREVAAFRKRKGAKKNRRTKAPSDYVDFARVAVLVEHADSIQYAVPLREDVSRLIPLEQLTVVITVDRLRRTVRHLSISLDDPLRIALGLARVSDLNFDIRFDTADDAPAEAQPSGVAEASVSRFGRRAEFSWTDFERVRAPDATPPPAAIRAREPLPSAPPR
jgi:hypothetical protein